MKTITATTTLSPNELISLEKQIKKTEGQLKKLKYGQIEKSLFLMEQLEGMRKTLAFNQSRSN